MCYSSSADPLGPIKHKKNTKLRIQLAHLETSLEFVFTVMSCLAVGYMNISTMAAPEHGKTPDAGTLVVSALIQYALEMACDFINIIYLTLYANQPYLEYATIHHRHYLFTMAAVCFFAGNYVFSSSIPAVLYRIAPLADGQICQTATCGHQSDWVWMMGCVLDSNSTYNRC